MVAFKTSSPGTSQHVCPAAGYGLIFSHTRAGSSFSPAAFSSTSATRTPAVLLMATERTLEKRGESCVASEPWPNATCSTRNASRVEGHSLSCGWRLQEPALLRLPVVVLSWPASSEQQSYAIACPVAGSASVSCCASRIWVIAKPSSPKADPCVPPPVPQYYSLDTEV